ncbi:hypothetical protein NPIL_681191 [Nephila pilipes]|uniref:Uncharacterized protein n=1 Tax=Nephila pilipes TaxID=299642 RepID=A0A8X6MVH6_NEPPI|nr:hypothetical protein NPIL_681191 [Nephila pilipes]
MVRLMADSLLCTRFSALKLHSGILNYPFTSVSRIVCIGLPRSDSCSVKQLTIREKKFFTARGLDIFVQRIYH